MLVLEKTSIYIAVELSLKEISCVVYAHAYPRAKDVNIVRSRNAQCKTDESAVSQFTRRKFFVRG